MLNYVNNYGNFKIDHGIGQIAAFNGNDLDVKVNMLTIQDKGQIFQLLVTFSALIGVGALWGLTNPILKKNSIAIKEIKANSAVTQFRLEIKYLLTHLGYIAPLIVNQLGSVLYFLTLQNVDLTLSVPLANSLTFIFTAVAGSYLEEKLPTKKVVAGSVFILFGTILCCYDKQLTDHL